jgi:hypothetical protein
MSTRCVPYCRWHLLVLALLAVSWCGVASSAGTVKQGLSSTESWVGSPIVLSLIFENAPQHDQPMVPDVPGLSITSTGPPSEVSSFQWSNGNQTQQSTLTYQFRIDAANPGHYTIPALVLNADGVAYSTEPIALHFRSSAATNLLLAEIQGVPDTAWVGDTIPATLRILIKPFEDEQLPDRVLSASDMWRQVKLDACQWGPFLKRITTIQSQRKFPPVSVVQVEGDTGKPERWYAYDIKATIPLLVAGPLDVTSILIGMNYPVRIGRARDLFRNPFSSLTITDSRPITATPKSTQTIVAPPPATGRPATWAGAVGDYSFRVTASPTDVGVGEPITLTMTVTDRSPQGADLDLLQAPLLHKDPSLIAHFRVPEERPGGVVSGKSKTFTQTIRPTSIESTTIAAIPFAFFNTTSGEYQSSLSSPVPLTVSSAKRVDSTAIGGVSAVAEPTTDNVTEVRGGLLANYTNAEQLLARAKPMRGWWLVVVLLVPPLAWVLATGLLNRVNADRNDPRRGRNRQAARVLAARLAESLESPEDTAKAIRSFVADRLGLPTAGLTSVEAVAAVAKLGNTTLGNELHTCLATLESASYAGGQSHVDPEAVQQLVKQLEEHVR